MKLPSKQDADTLEALIDSVGLYDVLSMIEGICAGKAEHIRVNWDDVRLAKFWDKAGTRICEVSMNPIIEELSK